MLIELRKAQKSLAILWGIFSGVIFCLLFISTIVGKYYEIKPVWDWFSTFIAAYIAMIVGTLCNTHRNKQVGDRKISVENFNITWWLSFLYLLLVAMTFFLSPFAQVYLSKGPVEFISLSYSWLQIISPIMGMALGMFFVSEPQNKTQILQTQDPKNLQLNSLSTETYRCSNALILAKFSAIAYEEQVNTEKALKDQGFDEFLFFSNGSTQGFITKDSKSLVISFRGTEKDIKDWVTDLSITLVNIPSGGKVHKGFYEALNLVWQDLLNCVRKFQNNNQAIWLTGHSLGGALAILTAFQLKNEGINISGIYTYGQPHVCNLDLAKKINREFQTNYFRLVNNNDIVPRLFDALGEYVSIGKFCYLDTNGNLHFNINKTTLIGDMIKGRLESLSRNEYLDGLSDHQIKRYIEILESHI